MKFQLWGEIKLNSFSEFQPCKLFHFTLYTGHAITYPCWGPEMEEEKKEVEVEVEGKGGE